MKIDINNFENFTIEEYIDNLNRLGIDNHLSLVGRKAYYSKKIYGLHNVIRWDENRGEYLLELDGQKFWSNPFRILTN